MKTFQCVVAIILVCLAGALQADVVSGNLLTNGAFDTDLTGWQEVSANCIWYDSTGDGGQGGVALLQANSYLYQYNTDHPFAAGETYTVSFQASGIGLAGPLVARFYDSTTSTVVGGVTLFGADLGTGNPVDFKTYSYQYVVDPSRVGHNWLVAFDSGGANVYAGVDNVSVTAIPEPMTVTLLLMGLIGMMAYAWRKR
jgi:hypothetical protein